MATKKEFILSQRLPGETANQLTSRLNAPITAPNPVPQTVVQDFPDIDVFLNEMAPAELFSVCNSLIYAQLDEALGEQNRRLSKRLVRACNQGTLISVATRDKLLALLDKDKTDPAWQPTVTTDLAAQNKFTITVDDVVQALT